MSVLKEALENLPSIQWQDNGKIMAVHTETPEACLILNSKIMTVLTEAPGHMPSIQWQDSDSSDRSTSKPDKFQ